VTEVEDLLCVRSGEAVEVSWRTPTPTSYQTYLEWFNCQGRDGSPVILEGPAKQLEHTLTAPGPGACGWGYIVPSGATQSLAPVCLGIGPAAEELDGASFTDLGPQEASCEVPESGTAAIADPGEPDSWSRPRPFRPDGPPATGCFQADYDTDYLALAVSSTSYPTEVEFEGCPAQVRLVPYEAPGYSLWLSGPRASARGLGGVYRIRGRSRWRRQDLRMRLSFGRRPCGSSPDSLGSQVIRITLGRLTRHRLNPGSSANGAAPAARSPRPAGTRQPLRELSSSWMVSRNTRMNQRSWPCELRHQGHD